VCALVLVAVTACVVGAREVEVPGGDEPVVIVGSARLPMPIGGVGRHPWVAMRARGESSWQRWEVMCCPDSSRYSTVKSSSRLPDDDYGAGGGDVRYHAVIGGKQAEDIIECVNREAPNYPHRDRYQVVPGPNSNTFVDWIVRECDIGADLPATSVGKDYRGVIGVSGTAGGTGVQLETYVAGIKLGLKEGIEIHILGLAFGIDLWPPALIVPVGPGRIGFADR
jgi:hypothetical protein